jgi:hypothetical protein
LSLVEIETDLDTSRRITVCAECLCASCFHGVFMCERSDVANTTTRTVLELRKLDREHPTHYSLDLIRRRSERGR